jgi:hypothetical protein
MARSTLYPQNNFERLLWWFVLAALSWALLLGLLMGARWLWCCWAG